MIIFLSQIPYTFSRSNSKCPIAGFDVRFPTCELNMNPELHLPLLVIIFIERAT